HADHAWKDRLLLASKRSTAGVLEGLRWFGVWPDDSQAVAERERRADSHSIPFPWGAIPVGSRRTQFTLFAPEQDAMKLEIIGAGASAAEHKLIEMKRDPAGYFSVTADDCPPGTDYRLRPGSETTSLNSAH